MLNNLEFTHLEFGIANLEFIGFYFMGKCQNVYYRFDTNSLIGLKNRAGQNLSPIDPIGQYNDFEKLANDNS